MSRFATVVFDLDGTLIDSYAALTSALNATAEQFSLRRHTVDEVRSLVGEGIETFLERAFGRVDPRVLSCFEGEYDRVCLEETRILPEVTDVLRELAEAELGIAVCTNKPTAFSVRILEHLDLLRWIGAVVGPDLAPARKPDGRHVLEAISRVGGAPASSLMVGDMPIDVAAARNAQCRVAVIATGSSSPTQLVAAEPDYFLSSFRELLTILDGVGVAG